MAKLQNPKAGFLLVKADKQVMIPINKDRMTIGRKQVDIMLDDAKVSTHHAELVREGTKLILRDTSSTNGTFVNRQQVKEHELTDQDVIEIGNSTLCYFENIGDFHGGTETTLGTETRPQKQIEATESTKRTATETIAQVQTSIRILEGPNEGKKFHFRKFHITIGRGETDLVLLDMDTSRSHCLLEVLSPRVVYLRDLDSTNGTFLNDEKILSEKVKTGDKIKIGNTTLELEITS